MDVLPSLSPSRAKWTHWFVNGAPVRLTFNTLTVFDYDFQATARHKGTFEVLLLAEKFLAKVVPDILNEPLELMVHLLHLFQHVQDNLYSSQIDSHVPSQIQNQLQPLDVFFRVIPGSLGRSRRFYQSLALIKPERLRVNIELLRHRADCIFFDFRLSSSHN